MELKKPMFVVSTEAKTIASVLRNTPVGGTIGYESISAAIGRDVRKCAIGALQTARRLVQSEDRMIFDTVHNVGLKRLADSEIVNLGDRARTRIRRTADNVVKKIVCVDYDRLSRDQQVKHNTGLSMFSILLEMSTDKSTARLQSAVESVGVDLPVAKATLAAIGL